ncbi:MAG: lamin tail domain-containing protein [Deltaproteobacteria bacterium]|nr:lamin tail domain-containing protein [Deltaproteobacteria bacterium]MBI4224460.1 lamin tail domain-containing protein [Deltaproteobacteria bacterium]
MRRAASLLIFFLAGCGPPDRIPFESSLLENQPQVISIQPADEAAFGGEVVEVIFSRPIDPKTLTPKTFAVTAVPEGEMNLNDLWGDADDGDLETHPGKFEISDDQKTVRFSAEIPFPPFVRCGVLITPGVLSVDRLPLNQTPGEGPTPFFSSFYTLAEASTVIGAETSAPSIPRPGFLMLNEVLYDAQGSDTNGDLFIELYGEPERNLSGYQILFVRGSDGNIRDALTIPGGVRTNAGGFFVAADAVTGSPGVTNVTGADWVANFDPPNGPDCIQLLDPDGNLVDALGYGSPLVLRAENDLLCYETTPANDAPSGFSLTRLAGAEETDNNAVDWHFSDRVTPGGPAGGEAP